jgi:hypothetical protein
VGAVSSRRSVAPTAIVRREHSAIDSVVSVSHRRLARVTRTVPRVGSAWAAPVRRCHNVSLILIVVPGQSVEMASVFWPVTASPTATVPPVSDATTITASPPHVRAMLTVNHSTRAWVRSACRRATANPILAVRARHSASIASVRTREAVSPIATVRPTRVAMSAPASLRRRRTARRIRTAPPAKFVSSVAVNRVRHRRCVRSMRTVQPTSYASVVCARQGRSVSRTGIARSRRSARTSSASSPDGTS